MDDRELRDILAEELEILGIRGMPNDVRAENYGDTVKAAISAMRRVATPQSMTITDEIGYLSLRSR